jgi:signal transduction histidine kinase
VAGKLLAETNNPAIYIIISLPTIIMALRYPLKYTVMTASVTTLVIIFDYRVVRYEFDYLFIFLSFIWIIGLLVNASMEVERQVQEERIKLQEKEKLAAVGQMAAGIAHEVRNPLTTIKGFVQLLNKRQEYNDTQIIKGYLEMINKEITRVDSLLVDFLQFARPNTPQLIISNINNTIEELRILLEAQCFNKGISLYLRLAPDLPAVKCDYNQIKQVIINMCINAMDAMCDCQRKDLIIETSFDTKYIHIRIEDTGCGIPQEQASRIFNPFYTTKESGSGLGLSVCYTIIENHQGKIQVETQINKGAKFLILLPRCTQD